MESNVDIVKASEWVNSFMLAMPPNTHIKISDVPVRDKELLVELVMLYIDGYHDAEFTHEYTVIRKQHKIPKE